ncbi:MAG: ASKHA domain-containing protein, partial [Bacillota bacterium]
CGGEVYVARCISAFVGGDITSAILSSGMRGDDASLLLDIGTNGEVALHAGGKLYVTSTAAGPAFEGSELSCGMAAVKGAVSAVYALSGELRTTVIGEAAPKGICGSGVIDAVALMKTSGAMDDTGRILEGPRTMEVDGAPAFMISESIYITQRDVRRIQTAEAAIAAGTLALIHRAGLTVGDIGCVYLAGGFGNYMDEENAIAIGLLPEESRNIIKNIGNAAGAGAGMALVKREYVTEHRNIADAAQHVELSTDAYFMEKYVDCMMF